MPMPCLWEQEVIVWPWLLGVSPVCRCSQQCLAWQRGELQLWIPPGDSAGVSSAPTRRLSVPSCERSVDLVFAQDRVKYETRGREWSRALLNGSWEENFPWQLHSCEMINFADKWRSLSGWVARWFPQYVNVIWPSETLVPKSEVLHYFPFAFIKLLCFFLWVIGAAVDASCGYMFTLICGEELAASAFLFAGQKRNALIACWSE